MKRIKLNNLLNPLNLLTYLAGNYFLPRSSFAFLAALLASGA